MANITKLYNEWLDKEVSDAGTKELKFGLKAFTAGFNARQNLKEEIEEANSANKRLALVTASNGSDEIKFIIGYDTTIDNMFDDFKDMARSILGGTFGAEHGYEVTDVTPMTTHEFVEIVGDRTAKHAWLIMEQRDYYYTIVSKGGSSAKARFVQMEDELDDEYYDFL